MREWESPRPGEYSAAGNDLVVEAAEQEDLVLYDRAPNRAPGELVIP